MEYAFGLLVSDGVLIENPFEEYSLLYDYVRVVRAVLGLACPRSARYFSCSVEVEVLR